MEYVMHGKLLTHLREQRSRNVSLFQFTEADIQGEADQARISSKDLTKYAYGVAKGMEYLVSKGVSITKYFQLTIQVYIVLTRRCTSKLGQICLLSTFIR